MSKQCRSEKTTERRLVYNDDSQGVYETNLGTVEQDLRNWIDKPLSNLPIDTYAWCIATPFIVMHDSAVGEVYGRRFDTPPDHAAEVMQELHRNGTDVLHIVADQAHHRGVEFIASVRMNDTHHRLPDATSPGVPQLLLDHPEYAIKRQDGIGETALDYSHAEVRQVVLAILQELAEEYDIDGLELDFTRWGKLFARNESLQKIDLMTEFVGDVRRVLDQAAKNRSRDRLTLGVAVPQSLFLSNLCGLDPKRWVENDWLDYIIQCDFNCSDLQIPVAEFAEFCKPARCTHLVRMGAMNGGQWRDKPYFNDRKLHTKKDIGYGGMRLTCDEARGVAASILGFGADGVGLWNMCCNMGERHKAGPICETMTREQYQQYMLKWAAEVVDPEKVFGGRRVYHFVPIYKSMQLVERNYPVNELRKGPMGEPVQIITFPPGSESYRRAYCFLMADGKNGEKLAGELRFRILQSTLDDRFAFDINGVAINPEQIETTVESDNELPAVWYQVALADCPPFAGGNELGITPTAIADCSHKLDAPEKYGPVPYMEELEITVESQSGGGTK